MQGAATVRDIFSIPGEFSIASCGKICHQTTVWFYRLHHCCWMNFLKWLWQLQPDTIQTSMLVERHDKPGNCAHRPWKMACVDKRVLCCWHIHDSWPKILQALCGQCDSIPVICTEFIHTKIVVLGNQIVNNILMIKCTSWSQIFMSHSPHNKHRINLQNIWCIEDQTPVCCQYLNYILGVATWLFSGRKSIHKWRTMQQMDCLHPHPVQSPLKLQLTGEDVTESWCISCFLSCLMAPMLSSNCKKYLTSSSLNV